ncbi:interleukin-1 receptor-associated kinase 3 isoform X3 [Saccopteryx bilineata]|uniref:interleukin-1 receptor-associated kinase 3 isoform X3 n=1 Tax=Saccopteryx bilineata TaxID=59482 RepID=UPI00338E7E9E
MAGSCGARAALSVHTLLFDIPPALLGELCAILDSCDGALGWRGLAERLSNNWLDVRHIEKYVDQGKSGTRELLWSWAQKNKTIGDLLQILQEMGHHRAIHLISNHGAALNPSDQSYQGDGFPNVFSKEKKIQCKKQWKRFLSELEVLLLFHHPNILELAAYFTENEKFCLVYPYMRNGSLFDRLQCVDNSAPLSWHIRISVLIGTAKAVQFLHNTNPCSVICGSISSANILLDDQFQPKLTDFAMAHFRPRLEHQSSAVSTTSGSSKHLWYLPEEYIRQGKLSTKTDVYSFGIVIMEVLTGCKVVLDDPKHIQLRDLLMELMEKRGFDSCLSFLDKKVFPCPRNFSAKLFSLAGQCAATRAKLRPSMDEVLTTLESTQASLYFAEDPPASLKSFRSPSPSFWDNIPSIPVEDDERQNNHSLLHDKLLRKEKMTQRIPFECSQSEVTFLGFDRKVGGKTDEDACHAPCSSCEECWSPVSAAPSQDSRVSVMIVDLSSEASGHSNRSQPEETGCSSEFFSNECDQNKKESILPEDKEDGKYY